LKSRPMFEPVTMTVLPAKELLGWEIKIKSCQSTIPIID
jgi:hypothetical protein